jgi:hypothetical protein
MYRQTSRNHIGHWSSAVPMVKRLHGYQCSHSSRPTFLFIGSAGEIWQRSEANERNGAALSFCARRLRAKCNGGGSNIDA